MARTFVKNTRKPILMPLYQNKLTGRRCQGLATVRWNTDWRRMHNGELLNLDSTSDIIRVIK